MADRHLDSGITVPGHHLRECLHSDDSIFREAGHREQAKANSLGTVSAGAIHPIGR